jgi:methyltransferase
MKTPISYYGGKQTMLKHILPLIPDHSLYTEAFCGGAAVLFAKRPVDAEIINDINMELTNFYWCAQVYYPDLKREIDKTLHSRDVHEHAAHINQYPQFFFASRTSVGCLGSLQNVVRFDDGRLVWI